MCDRGRTSIAQSQVRAHVTPLYEYFERFPLGVVGIAWQVGFIEFVVGPLYAMLLEIFPAMLPSVANVFANRDAYARGHVKESRVSSCCACEFICAATPLFSLITLQRVRKRAGS